MKRLNQTKLNHLLGQWPNGVILTTEWLKAQGYYKQLVKLYCDHGWIKSIGKSAYVRLNDKITWVGAVKALQSQLNIPVHVGGITALNLYGISQYLQLSDDNPIFYLYNTINKKINIPSWFQHYFTEYRLEQKKLFNDSAGLSTKEINGIQLNVSAPERAILEVLALVPNQITLSYAEELIENLDRLRGYLVQNLLENCYSIKVKRLFLYLAEKNNLSCFDELNINRFELGSGKRMIGQGGVYNAKWLLSLPVLNNLSGLKYLYL